MCSILIYLESVINSFLSISGVFSVTGNGGHMVGPYGKMATSLSKKNDFELCN